MPVAIAEKHISRKLTVNLDQHQINVRPIIKGKNCTIAILSKKKY
jgi:hypothetical protein